MAKILAFIILVLVVVGGVYYYDKHKGAGDPLAQYTSIIKLPTAEQAVAFENTVKGWVKDPASAIPYPKGWRNVSITDSGYTFSVVTPDTNNPPQYYAAFKFPKALIPSKNLIKCYGTSSANKTDICVVGDNPTLNAYFSIISWIKHNPLTNPSTNNVTVNTASSQ